MKFVRFRDTNRSSSAVFRGIGWCLVLALLGETANAESAYEEDISFALVQIEAKCGHFFELKGIDWSAVSDQFREEAKAVGSDQEHYLLLWRMLARLRDGHAAVLKTEKTQNIQWVEETPHTGLGMFWTRIGDGIFVKRSWAKAEDRGIRPGMRVLEVDGLSADQWLENRIEERSDIAGYSTRQQAEFSAMHWGLTAEVGSKVRVTLQDADGVELGVQIDCEGRVSQVPDGPAFFPEPAAGTKWRGNSDLHWCRLADDEGGFGYVHVRRCKGNLPEHMDEALADLAGVPGIVMDWRGNSGGGFDHDALFGRFIPKGKSTSWGKTYQSAGPNPYGGPVVVVIDATARSAGETGAGIFKEDGRAYVIGESPTAGMSSGKAEIALPSGLFNLRVSVYSNKGRFNNGRGIEGIGVIPHETVTFQVEDLEKERDTLIARAVGWLKKGFPENVVPYRPEDFGWEKKAKKWP